jgi:hypothetical protein
MARQPGNVLGILIWAATVITSTFLTFAFYIDKPTEAWYALSEEEQRNLLARLDDCNRQVGSRLGTKWESPVRGA